MTPEEKNKVRVDTVVGAINGGMLATTGAVVARKLVSGTAVRTVAGLTAGTLGRTAAATSLTAVAGPAVVTALAAGAVVFGICSLFRALNS